MITPAVSKRQPIVEMLVMLRVVEAGGFTAAARELGQRASSISRGIARLESHFGGALFNRGTRSVSLTELGTAVHAAAASIARTMREAEVFAQRYTANPTGRLRVSAPVVFGHAFLLPHLPIFLGQVPDVSLDLDLSDRLVDVSGESFDVAVRITTNLPPGLMARPLGSTSSVLVASANYLASAAAPQRPDDLAPHCILVPETALRGDELVMRDGASSRRISVPRRITINDATAILAAVRSHVGIGLVPDYAASAGLRLGDLERVLPDWEYDDGRPPANISAIYPSTRRVPRKVRAFIDFLVAHRAAFEAEE